VLQTINFCGKKLFLSVQNFLKEEVGGRDSP
jgi:hypothetical protein